VLLGQVMSKGDRMDYAIQKATELGVSTIQLLTSERCEMRLKYEPKEN
jgi:16S rRNA (uracil1498-N3)-methyltransferase